MMLRQHPEFSSTESLSFLNSDKGFTNKPVHFTRLTGKQINTNLRFKELQERLFKYSDENPVLIDAKRTRIVINGSTFFFAKESDEDSTIINLFNELTQNQYVLSFLLHHFQQQDFLFAGVDEFLKKMGADAAIRFVTCVTLLDKAEQSDDESISCRIIIFGYECRDVLNNPEVTWPESSSPHQPTIAFDTTYHIIPESIGVRVIVKEHNESIYHPHLDQTLKQFSHRNDLMTKLSVAEKNALYMLNQPAAQAKISFATAILALSGLLAVKSLVTSNSLLFELASNILDINTLFGKTVTTGFVTASCALGSFIYETASSHLADRNKGILLSDYQDMFMSMIEKNGLKVNKDLENFFLLNQQQQHVKIDIINNPFTIPLPEEEQGDQIELNSLPDHQARYKKTRFSFFTRSKSMPELSSIKQSEKNQAVEDEIKLLPQRSKTFS